MGGDLLVVLLILSFIVTNYLKRKKKSDEAGNGSQRFKSGGAANFMNNGDFFGKSMNAATEKARKFFIPTGDGNSRKISTIIAGFSSVVLLIWLASGFYIVSPTQQGIEMRFGKFSAVTLPGLHYRLPYPIEHVKKVAVTTVHSTEIGSGKSAQTGQQSESVMITRDENILDINFAVQWRIIDAWKFLSNIKGEDVGSTIRNTGESVMRGIIGLNDMSCILGNCRAQIAEDCRELLQKFLDEYKTGISVLSISIKRVDPPNEVREAFLDVQSARANREALNNEALSIRNDIIPRAKGEAAKIINAAEAYAYKTVNGAFAEVEKIGAFCPAFAMNEKLVKTWFETDILNKKQGMKKILLNSKEMNILNLPKEFFSSDQK